MASSDIGLVPNVLSSDECSKIPEDIRKKIESCVKIKTEESIVARALLETTKVNLGKNLFEGVIVSFGEILLSQLWEM